MFKIVKKCSNLPLQAILTKLIQVSFLKHISEKDKHYFLEAKYLQFNQRDFIDNDPISIPHFFAAKEDIEIAGFLTATIAWGQRKTIISNAKRLMLLMENSPHQFIMDANFDHDEDQGNHHNDDYSDDDGNDDLMGFKHRTFNGVDCNYFLRSLQNIYRNHGGLQDVFEKGIGKHKGNMQSVISDFKKTFFELPHPLRTTKHVSDPVRNSAAKRINMFLRWMVRKDNCGVDFGIWNSENMKYLRMPLDVHTGNVSRKLGLLYRKQNDWKAVEELTNHLKKFDIDDPVKYDFALFGLGVMEKF
ncbi:MAG TPA: TIGR02757 family protein [Flavobacteriales bacterium]|nr:TIGR02757 family protein [Flavobacteriales bacterium]